MLFACAGIPKHLSLPLRADVERVERASWRVSGDASEPRLVAVAAWQTRALFVTDAANECIKWGDRQSGEMKQVYRAERCAHVHNILLADSSRLDLYAIESLDESQVKETLFRLLRIRWKCETDKETWTVKWAEKFYEADSKSLDAKEQRTSLCRFEGHVLCAIARSRRLMFFKHLSDEEEEKLKHESEKKADTPKRAVGEQCFDEDIMHVEALSSHSVSLVAIAFVHSIRLYRAREDTQPKAAALNLQETFRITFGSVHKLLFYGNSLLVAERSSKEDKDNIWSWNIVDDKLETARRVHLDTLSSVQSWCNVPAENLIYCLDSATNNILSLKLE